MSAMHVHRNAKSMMLTTVRDALKHVAAALKNVEGWLDNNNRAHYFFGVPGVIILL
jgi:hypothetical protein